jgi:uncharacterized protein (TIGR02217 family)
MPIIMPTMPLSMAKGLSKSPSFNTVLQKGPAGINAAIALRPFPVWSFEFDLDSVQGHEQDAQTVVAQFLGTFMATCGGAFPFQFVDPQDSHATNAQFGIGDNVTTAFQLSRNIFGSIDIIQNLPVPPTIFVNGAVNAGLTISSSGIVTFTDPPAEGDVLTWSGSFRYLCRFSADIVDATRTFTINNMIDTWQFSSIKFSSEFQPGLQTFGKLAAPGGN